MLAQKPASASAIAFTTRATPWISAWRNTEKERNDPHVIGPTSTTALITSTASRLRLQAFGRLSSKYLDELETLMNDPNPIIRSRALEHFRKTTGLEASGGVHVNVTQQMAVVTPDRPRSFEDATQRVLRMHAEEEQAERAIESGSAMVSTDPRTGL